MNQGQGGYPPQQYQQQQPYPDPYQQQQQQQYDQQQYQYQQPQQPHQPQQDFSQLGSGDHDPMAMQRLGPKGQKLLADIAFLPGESIQYVAAADGYFIGANPMLKLMATIGAFLTTITGGYLRIFLIVTDQRLLLINATQQWCGWMRKRAIHAVALASIAECGSSRETQCCCIHSRFVNVETKTQNHQLVVKKFRDPDLKEFVAQLSAVIVANVQARTAV